MDLITNGCLPLVKGWQPPCPSAVAAPSKQKETFLMRNLNRRRHTATDAPGFQGGVVFGEKFEPPEARRHRRTWPLGWSRFPQKIMKLGPELKCCIFFCRPAAWGQVPRQEKCALAQMLARGADVFRHHPALSYKEGSI